MDGTVLCNTLALGRIGEVTIYPKHTSVDKPSMPEEPGIANEDDETLITSQSDRARRAYSTALDPQDPRIGVVCICRSSWGAARALPFKTPEEEYCSGALHDRLGCSPQSCEESRSGFPAAGLSLRNLQRPAVNHLSRNTQGIHNAHIFAMLY